MNIAQWKRCLRGVCIAGGNRIFLAFVCGRLAYTVCRFGYSQLALQFKMRLKERYLYQITERLLKADHAWIYDRILAKGERAGSAAVAGEMAKEKTIRYSRENLEFFDKVQELEAGRIKTK